MRDYTSQTLDISAVTSAAAHTAQSRIAALALAAAGIALLWVVGFAEVEVLHNIAHDTRHSNVFPCH